MSDTWFFDALPDRPPPHDDECLSGYLLRVAAAYAVTDFRAFVQSLFPDWHNRRQVHILRWEYPVERWGALPVRLQLTEEKLERLTLLPWVAKFGTPPVRDGILQFSPAQILRSLAHPTLQVCPLCLQERPYRRLLWRLQPVVACLRHGGLLQKRCHDCGQLLPVVDSFQRHLCCGHCGADLRQLPVVPASAEVLAEEAQLQPEWQFLLDPATSLVGPSAEGEQGSVSRRLGLKLRYLREQREDNISRFARASGLGAGVVSSIERGTGGSLLAYLAYMRAVPLSWRELATLALPEEYVLGHSQPPLFSLRVCPEPACENHRAPTARVTITGQRPERQQASFRCKECGRRFTRAYSGELVTKPRLADGERPAYVLLKPDAEIARARQLGLQGKTDRAVAQELGWTTHNAFSCWRVLGIYEEVKTARRRRREQEKQQRYEVLRERVDVVLNEFCQQDEPITLSRVGQALGHTVSFLRIGDYPELAGHVKAVALTQQIQCRQRRVDRWREQIEAIVAHCHDRDIPLTIYNIIAEVGLTYWQLRDNYPELMAVIRQAVQADRAMRRNNQIASQCVQISQAATALAARGVPLTKASIVTEARKHMAIDDTVPQVREWLLWWTGAFGARD